MSRNGSKGNEQYVGNYKLLQSIGEGHSGKVRLALHTITDEMVAVKIVDKTKLEQAWAEKLVREVHIMKLLDHPNIIKLYEVIDTETTLYVFMEYASGGELFDYLIKANGRLPEETARRFFRQILMAVEYCHSINVVHRDLKAENVLLDKDLNVKIADFGFSNYFKAGAALETFCGSPDYCAPELFLRHAYEGPEVDVWAMGVILYILVTGSMPFQDPLAVCEGRYHIPSFVSPDCARLIQSMLATDRSVRVTCAEIMGFSWCNKNEHVILRPCGKGRKKEAEGDGRSGGGANGSQAESEEGKMGDKEVDTEVAELMRDIGYSDEDIAEGLKGDAYNTITATYLLFKDRKSKSPDKHQAELRTIRAKQAATKAAAAAAAAAAALLAQSHTSSPPHSPMGPHSLSSSSLNSFGSPSATKKSVTERTLSAGARARAGSAGPRSAPAPMMVGDDLDSKSPKQRRRSMLFFLGGDKEKDPSSPTSSFPSSTAFVTSASLDSGMNQYSNSPPASPSSNRRRRPSHVQSPLAIASEEGEFVAVPQASSLSTATSPRSPGQTRRRSIFNPANDSATMSDPSAEQTTVSNPGSPQVRPRKGSTLMILGSGGEEISSDEAASGGGRKRSPSTSGRRPVSVSGTLGSLRTRIRGLSITKTYSLSSSADSLNEHNSSQGGTGGSMDGGSVGSDILGMRRRSTIATTEDGGHAGKCGNAPPSPSHTRPLSLYDAPKGTTTEEEESEADSPTNAVTVQGMIKGSPSTQKRSMFSILPIKIGGRSRHSSVSSKEHQGVGVGVGAPPVALTE